MGVQVRDIFVTLGFDVDNKDLDNLDRSLMNIQKGVKGMTILFAGASLAIGGFLKAAGDFEQTEIAFETLLGNAKEGKQLLKELGDFAARTPFTLPGVEAAARQLLGVGIESDKMIGTLKALGDVSAGLSVPLSRLALNYGQIKSQAKLTGRELRDFAIAGVPLLETLADQLGKDETEITKLVSAGKIGFPEVEKAFISMSSEGGKFFDLMDKQSKSFLGLISNISDNLIRQARTIGKELLPQAKAIANEFLAILEVNREIIKGRMVKFFKSVSVTLGVLFKVAKAVVEAILNVTDAMGGLETVIKAVAFAMIAFTGLNVLAAIGGVTTLIFKLIKGFKILGVTIRATQASALIIPILIGAAVVALGLIIEDIVGFFRGKDSITGLIIDTFEKKFPDAFINMKAAIETIFSPLKTLKTFLGFIVNQIDELTNKIADFLTGPIKGLAGAIQSGFGALGFQTGLSPATAPATNSNSQSSQVNINAPMTVTVPEGTPAALVGDSLTEGFERAFGGLIRQASRATEPVTEF